MLKIVAMLNIYLLPSQSLVSLKSVTDLGSIPEIVRLSVAYNLAEAGNKVILVAWRMTLFNHVDQFH